MGKNLPYDPLRDFVPISRVASASNVLVVNTALEAKSVCELVRLAKERAWRAQLRVGGIGSPAHLAGEMLNLLGDVKVDARAVQGRDARAARRDRGQRANRSSPRRSPPARTGGGQVRALATTGKERNPGLPGPAERSPKRFPVTRSRRHGESPRRPERPPAACVKRLTDEVVRGDELTRREGARGQRPEPFPAPTPAARSMPSWRANGSGSARW